MSQSTRSHRVLRPHGRVLVIPDTHVPYHDPIAWELAIKAAKRLKPSHIVVIGDFADCYSISQFPKDPSRKQGLKWEIHEVNRELNRLQGLSDEVHFTEGNHEYRLERYLTSQAPALYGLVTTKELLEIPRRGWKWTPYKQFTRIGKVAFTHEVGHAGKTALQLSLAAFGGNLVFGHTHRGGLTYDGTVDGQHRVGLNVGWLGDPTQIDYAHRSQTRSWQQGIGLVEMDRHGNGWCQFAPIIKGRIIVGGEVLT